MYPHHAVAVPGVGGGGRGGVLVGGGGREVAAGVEAVPVAVPLVTVLLVHQPGPGRLEDVGVDIGPPGGRKGQSDCSEPAPIITCAPIHRGTL